MGKSKGRLTISLPLEVKNHIFAVALSSSIDVSELVVGLVQRTIRKDVHVNFYEKRARSSTTLIPQEIVRKLLDERRQNPPTPYRELARRYGYALRTVHRACTGQGGYRLKVKRTALGRKSRLTPEQLAAILIDSQSMTIAQLVKKYQVSYSTIYRAIAGVGCYGKAS